MVALLAQHGDAALAYLPQMQKYAYWMDGDENLQARRQTRCKTLPGWPFSTACWTIAIRHDQVMGGRRLAKSELPLRPALYALHLCVWLGSARAGWTTHGDQIPCTTKTRSTNLTTMFKNGKILIRQLPENNAVLNQYERWQVPVKGSGERSTD